MVKHIEQSVTRSMEQQTLVKNGPFYPWDKNGGTGMRKVLRTG